MPDLFEKTNIKSMQLKNRLVRSATFEKMCDSDGYPTDELSDLYEKLAKGGIGLLITGWAAVSKDEKTAYTSRIDNDDVIPIYKEIIEKVHNYDCCIAMQINHAGRQAIKNSKGDETIAPSAVKNQMTSTIPREMTEQDIERVIDDFIQAALRVKKAGFDAVQIQGSSGMLINQFLSPYTNRRKDKWGGTFENRTRFLKEIYNGSRKILGENYPILIKLNVYDNMKHGLKLDEGVKIAEMASEMGFDGIEVSCGIFDDGYSMLRGNFPVEVLIEDFKLFEKNPILRFIFRHFGQKLSKFPVFSHGFNLDAANIIKEKINKPVFTVGGMHDPKMMIDAVKNNKADYISLSRPLIMDPAFPLKIKEGNLTPSKCLQCNHCFFYLMKGPLKCYYGQRIGNNV